MIYSITILLNIQKKACLKVTSLLCNQFLSNSISIVFNFRAGFGDVQSMIVKIAHAKRKKKTLVPWMMKKLSKDERKILDRDMEASGHKGIYVIMQIFN